MKVERIENVGIVELDKPDDMDNELFVKDFFEEKGYQALKLKSKDTSMEIEKLKEFFPFIEKVLGDKSGMPDYLVFRLFQEVEVDDYSIPKVEVSDELSDWFFVEVKGENDSLQLNQLEWYRDHQEFPVYIVLLK